MKNIGDVTMISALMMQGMNDTGWTTTANATLALRINELAREVADREMGLGLSVGDFAQLLASEARRAEIDADT